MQLQRDVAPGIHLVSEAYVNWYVVEDGGRLTLVDAGLPRSWGTVQQVLSELGRSPGDVEAIVLTHGHFDHVGFAERARREWGTHVWVHERDRPLSRHPLHYEQERSLARYLINPGGLLALGSMIAHGMPVTKGVAEVRGFRDEDVLDVPGRPRPIFTPGHTHGHVALHFPETGTLISGDALVTLDPYTGRRGPRLVARAATADVDEAMASLQRLAETHAQTVLPGHGEPWTDGVQAAVDRARERGAA